MTYPINATARRFSLAALNELGARYGVDYRLVERSAGGDCVLEGEVDQQALDFGGILVLSRVRSLQAYQARSKSEFCLSVAVLMQGEAIIGTEQGRRHRLAGDLAITMLDRGDTSILAEHPRAPTLQGLNLSLRDPDGLGDERLQERLWGLRRVGRTRLTTWRMPSYLQQGLLTLMNGTWRGDLAALHREGVALQLLAHALSGLDTADHTPTLSARDRRLLQRVFERLQEQPEREHSLASLAALACMSPSALRAKFPQAYGQTVFACLRERRLTLARQYLEQGVSVQQAAHFVGYRHASNFTTAFRAHFGMPPRQWLRR